MLHQFGNVLQRLPVFRIMSADSDKEVFPDEEVHLIGEKSFILVAEGIENDKGIVEEVFHLRDLFVIEAILDRQRMNSQEINQIIQFIFLRAKVVKPYETSFPQGGDSFGE
jgi:hypothetical protein